MFIEQVIMDMAYMKKTTSQKQYLVIIIDKYNKLVSLNAIAQLDVQTVYKSFLNK